MNTQIDVDRIHGKPRTIRELFTARKYSLDYFQREYAWSQANVVELIDDLSGRFFDSWDESHEPESDVSEETAPQFTGAHGDAIAGRITF